MRDEEVSKLAARLNVPINESTAAALERAIERELLGLQSAELTDDQSERRRDLTAALGELREAGRTPPSTELVTLTSSALADLVKIAASAGANEPTPEERMRSGVQVAMTQARKDFRNSRSLPLAGFGAVVLFIWSQRETFGISFEGVEPRLYLMIAFGALGFAAAVYYVAWMAQQRDEYTLRALYSPENQMVALHEVLGGEAFDIRAYKDALASACRLRPMRRQRLLSTVDLASALDDATDLSLQRFTKLGAIEPVDPWMGVLYRSTGKIERERSTPRH